MQEVTEGSWAGPWRKELKERSRRNAAQCLTPQGLLDQLCIQGTLAQWWLYPHWAELSSHSGTSSHIHSPFPTEWSPTFPDVSINALPQWNPS